MYKTTLDGLRNLAEQIREGEYQSDVQLTSAQGIMTRPKARPNREEKDAEPTFEDMMLETFAYLNNLKKSVGDAPETSARPKTYDDVVYERTTLEDSNVDYKQVAKGLREAANTLGMNPIDLATIVSYETGGTFNPSKSGPTTKWGTHKGLIQFGEPQANQYGVDWNDPYGSQLGKEGAIVRYFKDRGYETGMGLLDAYSIVNAGAPGLYDRSDTAAGGAPGTVRDKVYKQMSGHKAKARRLMETYTGEEDV